MIERLLRDSASPATENPLQVSFWLGKVDPRPLALFRILFGLTVCHDLLNYAGNLGAFATDQGMLPRGVQADPRAWSLFELTGSSIGVGVLFALGCAVVVSFTLGYRTQPCAALSWLFLTSLHTRNLYVTDGGDDLVRCLMFLSAFGNLGGCWSLDARRTGQASRAVPVLALRFLQLHIALLYFCAARLKYRAGWLRHNVIFQCLQLTGFVRPLGALLAQSPALCRASTLITPALEGAFAFLAFSPVRVRGSRALAIAAGTAVQLGILLTMRVGVFTETMLSAMALFARPEWFDWLARSLNRPALAPALSAEPLPETTRSRLPMRLAAFAFLTFNFVSLAWGPFIARRFPPPAWVMAERRWLWLDQPFGLFDVVYQIPSWHADGITVAGARVDVLPSAIPELVPVIAWRFSRWYKFTFKERERPFRFAALGAYVCRKYEQNTGQRLQEFTIIEQLTPPRLPGREQGLPQSRARWHQVCSRP